MRALLLLFALAASAHAQGGFTAELTSDKESYDYGETITLTYTVTNTGTETVDLYGPSSCGAFLTFGTLRLPLRCTADEVVYAFSPGESNSWIWTLVPSKLGVPEAGGAQTARGISGVRPRGEAAGPPDATVAFQAPQYLGGPLAVGFDTADADTVAALRRSVGGEVTGRTDFAGGESAEFWQISGTTLADAIAALTPDDHIRYAEAAPVFDGLVYTPTERPPAATFLTAPAPNPTAAQATFTVRLERPGPVLIDLVDVQGRRVAVVHDGPLAGGAARTFAVSAAGLPAGVYLVRVVAGGVHQSHRITVAR